MQPRPSSPLLRYWLARLRPLTRPLFWVPLSLMGVLGLFAWELSTKPDWLTALVQSPPSAGSDDLSKEEQAIAADIDTLPLLLNDFGLVVPETDDEQSANALSPNIGNSPASIPLLGASSKDQDAAAKPGLAGSINTLTDRQPLGLAAGNRMALGDSAALNAMPGDTAQLPKLSLLQPNSPPPVSALATALAQAQGTTPADQSALAAALARYPSAAVNVTDPNRLTVNPLSPLNPTALPPLEGTTGLSGSLSGNLQGSQPPVLPLEGSTGWPTTVPITPATNAFGNLTGNPTAPTGLVPAPAGVVQNPAPVGAISNFGPTGPANPAGLPLPSATNALPSPIQANPQPFSVPRPVPGRSIGGGNINTFSNP
jgi:hypothetical protein